MSSFTDTPFWKQCVERADAITLAQINRGRKVPIATTADLQQHYWPKVADALPRRIGYNPLVFKIFLARCSAFPERSGADIYRELYPDLPL